MCAIFMCLIHFGNVMSIVTIGIVAHAEQTVLFIFVTLDTFFAGLIIQHVDS